MADGKSLAKAVRHRFSSYYDDACNEVLAERKQDARRVFFLRPSSFPYCGVRKVLDWPKACAEGPLTHMSSSMLFYVSVGTAFHNVFQEVLGKHGKLLGNWVCPTCRSVKPASFYSRCKKCDVPRQYHELEVLFKNTLVGHLDGIFFDEKTGTWWVVDYKSTSSRNVWKHKKYADVFPYKTNKAQIRSYVPLIEKQLGKRISGYMLVYLPRDNPFDAKVVCVKHMGPKAKSLELARLKRYVKAHRQALQVKDLKGFSSLYEHKLCLSKKDYESNYENPYERCPHVDYCFDKPKMLKHASSVLKDTSLFPMLDQAPKDIRTELGL
jgi:hypothetical protein